MQKTCLRSVSPQHRIKLLLFAAMLALALPFFSPVAHSQTTGEVNFDYLGIRFVIPDGWLGQEVDGGYLMGSHTEPGFVFLTLHDTDNLQDLRRSAAQGIYEEAVMLRPAGELDAVGQQGLGGEYAGVLSGQQVKAYIVGLINPHGQGVTIIAATQPGQYSARYRTLALAIADSMRFSKAVAPPVVEQWQQALRNMRLTYMESYYSSGPSYDGYSTGGGYSTNITIDLCAQGHFKHNNQSSVSVDTGGAFGHSGGSGGGSGAWEIVGGAQNSAVLMLRFHDGSRQQYNLDYRDDKTLLNGKRWFRTSDAVCP